jgi:hypothetical protein
MGLDKIYERCCEPKETNRQIGPMFKRWIKNKSLGIMPVDLNKFQENDEDAILEGSDEVMANFAKHKFGYNNNKGLDFIARFNKKYIIGEAKFLTDFGGHQNAQLNDAFSVLDYPSNSFIKVAILDGVPYIKSNNKMYQTIVNSYSDSNIMSALVLREFLYSL